MSVTTEAPASATAIRSFNVDVPQEVRGPRLVVQLL
jgi:hypothetical protein